MAGRKRNVQFNKPDEPDFIKKFKERVGYKEGPSVDTKRSELMLDDDEENINPSPSNDLPDELPTVVVLRSGDLSQEEAEEILKKQQAEEIGEAAPSSGGSRIVFKKPVKKTAEESEDAETNLKASSSSKKTKTDQKTEKSADKRKKIKNNSLLSFDVEDE